VLTVDDYGAIRRARRDKKSIRQIARELRHSRRTVRHALVQSEPKQTPCTRNRLFPVLGPFQAIIDQILADDEEAPPKQRHTAAQVFRRLHDEQGYAGCYGQVQRYVRKHRRRHQETFIPLSHLPGQRIEADFGHIHVQFPDGLKLVPFLVATWAYSNAPFVLALPFERTEAILAGMVAAFDFFECVPKEVWWDNPKTVATTILLGRERRLHSRYAALAAHYAFNPMFCMPARGNEKPDAESTVKGVQRRFATPVPKVADLAELNSILRQRCIAERERTVRSLFGPFKIAPRFVEEQAAAAPLPNFEFDACVIRDAAAVDKYQTAAFDSNRYSVPRSFAHQTVTVKGYVDRVDFVAGGRVIASHPRSLARGQIIPDATHYLAALERKPAALDHSPVYRDWKLPACFAAFRTRLEERHGAAPGTRRYIRILQLMIEHPMDRVRRALEDCSKEQIVSAEAVIERARSLAAIDAASRSGPSAACPGLGPGVQVPLPDLKRFDELLRGPMNGHDPPSETCTVCAAAAPTENASTVIFA
jgi:transposase